jgi:hypothetical protein
LSSTKGGNSRRQVGPDKVDPGAPIRPPPDARADAPGPARATIRFSAPAARHAAPARRGDAVTPCTSTIERDRQQGEKPRTQEMNGMVAISDMRRRPPVSMSACRQ